MENGNQLVWFPVAQHSSAHIPSQCREGQWAAGKVVSHYANKVRLQIGEDSDNQVECSDGEVIARHPLDHAPDDIAELVDVNEPNVMRLLRTRYAKDQIHTKAHAVLVVINPTKTVRTTAGESIYSTRSMQEYISATTAGDSSLPPHIFSTAVQALHCMQQEHQSHSIVLNGLSGSGKTENTKLLLEFLLSVQGLILGLDGPRSTRKDSLVRDVPVGSALDELKYSQGGHVGTAIMSFLQVMERFGIAATPANQFSSRTMKYIKLHYDPQGNLAGGAIRHILLDHGRVARSDTRGENFSVFYELLAATPLESDDAEKLKLLPQEEYRLLQPDPKCHPMSQEPSDKEALASEFGMLRSAMAEIGIEVEDQESIWAILSAILLLGNIEFKETDRVAATEGTQDYFDRAAYILGIEPRSLHDSLLYKTAGLASIPLKLDDVLVARDSLICGIYERLCQHLLKRGNHLLSQRCAEKNHQALQLWKQLCNDENLQEPMFIGILDPVGFESCTDGSLRQLLSNYTEERMLQLQIAHAFKSEAAVYADEDIKWDGVQFADNLALINLIDKKPTGIFSLLDEVIMFPRSNDSSLLQKVQTVHGKNSSISNGTRQQFRTHFVIHHSHQKVAYNVTGFLNQNKDKCSPTLEALFRSSNNRFMAAMYTPNEPAVPDAIPSSNQKAGIVGRTAASKGLSMVARFKDSVNKFIQMVSLAKPSFVTCVQPNHAREKGLLDYDYVLNQLRLYHVLEGAKMRRSGFTYRRIFAVFFHRYYNLTPFNTFQAALANTQTRDYKSLCKQLVPILWRVLSFQCPIEETVQYGNKMIFIQGCVAQQIDLAKSRYEVQSVTAVLTIQSFWRMACFRQRFLKSRRGIQRMQASFRTKRAVVAYRRIAAAAARVNRSVKMFVARLRYLKQRAAIRVIQHHARKYVVVSQWRRRRRALHALHAASRGYLVRMQVRRVFNAVLNIQAFGRKCLRMFRQERRRLTAAEKIQAVYRGHRTRTQYSDVRHIMAGARIARAAKNSVAILQARWKRVLVSRRFLELRHAACKAQAWTRGRVARQKYRALRSMIIWIQATFRARRVRQRFYGVVALAMLEQEYEARCIRQAQELEALQRTCTQELAHRAGSGQVVVDIDTIVDGSHVYNDGWSATYARFRASLQSRGRRMTSIAFGSTHTLALDETGDVYSWGWSDCGQLGHGTTASNQDSRRVETLLYSASAYDANNSRTVSQTITVKQIVAGQAHTMILSNSGRVYTWGCNKRGQLGFGQPQLKFSMAPKTVDALRAQKVLKLSAGSQHSTALTETGTMYIWGQSSMLGLGQYTTDAFSPLQIKAFSHIKLHELCCGWKHTAALTKDGDIYCWGDNSQGQVSSVKPDAGSIVSQPVLVQVEGSSVTPRFLHISAGGKHTLAVTISGRAFAWGWNKFGQLGLGTTIDMRSPSCVKALKQSKIVQACAGWRQSLFLTDDSQVYACGVVSNVDTPAKQARSSAPATAASGVSSTAVQEISFSDLFYGKTTNPALFADEFAVHPCLVPLKQIHDSGRAVSAVNIIWSNSQACIMFTTRPVGGNNSPTQLGRVGLIQSILSFPRVPFDVKRIDDEAAELTDDILESDLTTHDLRRLLRDLQAGRTEIMSQHGKFLIFLRNNHRSPAKYAPMSPSRAEIQQEIQSRFKQTFRDSRLKPTLSVHSDSSSQSPQDLVQRPKQANELGEPRVRDRKAQAESQALELRMNREGELTEEGLLEYFSPRHLVVRPHLPRNVGSNEQSVVSDAASSGTNSPASSTANRSRCATLAQPSSGRSGSETLIKPRKIDFHSEVQALEKAFGTIMQELTISPTHVLASDQRSEASGDDENDGLKAVDTLDEGSTRLSSMIERIRRIGDAGPNSQLRMLH